VNREDFERTITKAICDELALPNACFTGDGSDNYSTARAQHKVWEARIDGVKKAFADLAAFSAAAMAASELNAMWGMVFKLPRYPRPCIKHARRFYCVPTRHGRPVQ
jgi:hypothetical protein